MDGYKETFEDAVMDTLSVIQACFCFMSDTRGGN